MRTILILKKKHDQKLYHINTIPEKKNQAPLANKLMIFLHVSNTRAGKGQTSLCKPTVPSKPSLQGMLVEEGNLIAAHAYLHGDYA